MALIELLLVLSILAALFGVALPRALSLYARVAVEYEAMHLVGELRRMQAVSRTTGMPLYMMQGQLAWKRNPTVEIRPNGYVLRRLTGGNIRTYETLPRVRLVKKTQTNNPISFDSNGDIDWRTPKQGGNMTILVYAEGYESEGVRVIIDRAARIRLERGAQDAVGE